MKSVDSVGITFANLVLGRGINNGVVNITLGAYEFNPEDDGKTIDPSPVIVCRLRTDMPFLRTLHKVVGDMLNAIDNPGKPNATELTHDESEPQAKPN